MQVLRSKPAVWAASVLIVAVAVEAVLLTIGWPFTRRAIVKALRSDGMSEVQIRRIHQTFFPRPGCIADGVEIYRGQSSGAPPLIAIERLVFTGNYGALLTFRKHFHELRATGVHIRIPASGSGGGQSSGSSGSAVSLDRLFVENTLLQFEPKQPNTPPFQIMIHRLALSPAGPADPMSFSGSLHLPEPPGEVQTSGRFGPWNRGDPFRTQVSGSYTFRQADLGKFSGLAGILGSSGAFDGSLGQLRVRGQANVPDFEVKSASHRVPVETHFRATVNGRTGDVQLNQVKAQVLRTELEAQGGVAAESPGAGKTLSLEMVVPGGRIQDLLEVVSSGPPGITGSVTLRFAVRIPPGQSAFLEKLELTGQMGVRETRFTNPQTQSSLERVARNAPDGDDDPASVVSDLKGRILVRHGLATFRDVAFQMPGASATLHGTYQLLTKGVDLHGTLILHEKLSKTSSGIKAVLLKVLDPVFQKRSHISVVPFHITGTYGHTSIGIDR